ncbi:unnamed protein product, partial [Mesorhabditis spiculigera]
MVLSIVWLILLVLGCVALAILPYPDVNHYFQYSGSQIGARIFASVMFFILVCLCISKFMMTVIVYRYWKILKFRTTLESLV